MCGWIGWTCTCTARTPQWYQMRPTLSDLLRLAASRLRMSPSILWEWYSSHTGRFHEPCSWKVIILFIQFCLNAFANSLGHSATSGDHRLLVPYDNFFVLIRHDGFNLKKHVAVCTKLLGQPRWSAVLVSKSPSQCRGLALPFPG